MAAPTPATPPVLAGGPRSPAVSWSGGSPPFPQRARTLSSWSQCATNALRFDAEIDNWVHAQRSRGNSDAVAVQQEHLKPRRWRLWLLVFLAALTSGVLSFLCNASGAALQHLASPPEKWSPTWQLAYRAALCTALSVAAYGTAATLAVRSGRELSQFVGGSGIPELSCELGGVHLMGIYDWRILAAKLTGLALACGAGLPVGMEGPFVHASACVGHLMMKKIPAFRELLHWQILRHMVITTMVAVGVADTFTAPLGGVLYALEITDTFASAAYLHCFFGATVAGIVGAWLRAATPASSIFHFEPLFHSDARSQIFTVAETLGALILHTILGVVCGVLGAVFVRLHRVAVGAVGRFAKVHNTTGPLLEMDTPPPSNRESVANRESVTSRGQRSSIMSTLTALEVPVANRQLRLAFVVAVVGFANALLTWCLPILRRTSQPAFLDKLVSTGEMDWGQAPWTAMSACLALKFAVTVLTLALPLPMGAIAPAFVLGALLGRFFGELLFPFCTSSFFCPDVGKDQFVAQFALVGASAFVAGSMRSFAQVIIVFERTSLPQLLLPLCSSALAAIFVANTISAGFFDSLIMLKRLPHLPSLARGRDALAVSDVMTGDFPTLTVGADATEIERVRGRFPRWQYEVPLVTHLEGCAGLGKGSPVLLSALRRFPSGAQSCISSGNAVVPLQVPCHTTVRSLLPLLTSLEKTVAFVVQDTHLVGAVTLTELYSRACDR